MFAFHAVTAIEGFGEPPADLVEDQSDQRLGAADVLNGKPVVTGLFGYKDVKKDRTDYNVYAMPVSDCKRGFGTIFELDFAGRQVGKSDVALDGQSMSSAVATTLCEKL